MQRGQLVGVWQSERNVDERKLYLKMPRDGVHEYIEDRMQREALQNHGERSAARSQDSIHLAQRRDAIRYEGEGVLAQRDVHRCTLYGQRERVALYPFDRGTAGWKDAPRDREH